MNTPKFNIGDKVYHASTQPGKQEVECPDCLGEKKWSVKSPAGYECETQCPRCRGAGTITKQFQYEPYVRTLTIGSVRMDTNDKDDIFTYMCNETGVGSGSVYRESKLFTSADEADTVAKFMAKEQTESHTERTIDPNRDLALYDLQFNDAAIKEANSKAHDATWAYQRLIGRICELDEYPVSGGEFKDEPTPHLTDEQVRGVQNSLVWLDKKATNELIAYRDEND